VDTILELDRPSSAGPRERVPRALSRYPQTPEVLRFDFDPTTRSWAVREREERPVADLPLAEVWQAIRDEPGLSKRKVRAAVPASNEAIDAALAALIKEGYVERRQGGRGSAHYPAKPYANGPCPTVPDRARGTLGTVPRVPTGPKGPGHSGTVPRDGTTVPGTEEDE
jgi:hypothetical protein